MERDCEKFCKEFSDNNSINYFPDEYQSYTFDFLPTSIIDVSQIQEFNLGNKISNGIKASLFENQYS